MLLFVGDIRAQVLEKYEGKGLDEVRLHYTLTNSLLGAMAGSTLAGSNAELFSEGRSAKISIGIGGALIGAALAGYLGYPNDRKLSGGFEKSYFTLADGFLGAVVVGFSTAFLADAIFPQTGDVPASALIGGLAGSLGGGLLGGVYGYRFAVRF